MLSLSFAPGGEGLGPGRTPGPLTSRRPVRSVFTTPASPVQQDIPTGHTLGRVGCTGDPSGTAGPANSGGRPHVTLSTAEAA